MRSGTITRRMNQVLSGLETEFASVYDAGDFRWKLKELLQARSNRLSVLASLYTMFDACGIPYEMGRDNRYYQQLVETAKLPTFADIEDRMLQALYDRYESYLSPRDYMLRMVDKLSDPADGWQEDPLRVRILKQFIKYGNYLADVTEIKKDKAGQPERKKNGEYKEKPLIGGKTYIKSYVADKLGHTPTDEEVLSALDDGVFAALEGAGKDARAPEGKLGLLKIVDDLAGGMFRTGGATKRSLYLFAIVYNMTFYTGAEGELRQYDSDVEKNLFGDYYTNNLMRYLSASFREKLSETELDPAGMAVNYKNFAEMVYIYYIAGDYTPREKLKRSARMIQRIRDGQRGSDNASIRGGQDTAHFKGRVFRDPKCSQIFCEDLLRSSEEEFETFLCENYDCNVLIPASGSQKAYMVGVMELGTEQNTAYRNYLEILDKLRRMDIPLENCNYGLWFADVGACGKGGFDAAKAEGEMPENFRHLLEEYNRQRGISGGADPRQTGSRLAAADPEKFSAFMELLLAVNSYLGKTTREAVSYQSEAEEKKALSRTRIRALSVSDPRQMSRTSMIVAYYYYYNARREQERSPMLKSFREFFGDFRRELNGYLENSGYLPLSGKNIFDVLVVFSAYAYYNV